MKKSVKYLFGCVASLAVASGGVFVFAPSAEAESISFVGGIKQLFRDNVRLSSQITELNIDTTSGLDIVQSSTRRQQATLTGGGASGGGNVSGPVSSTDRAIPTYNGTAGNALRDNSTVLITSGGDITLAALDTVDGRDLSVDGARLDGFTAVSTDNAIVRFDGTVGATQNSAVTIDDSGNIGVGTGATVDGVDISAHATRHLPGAADALTTAAAVSIGTANAAGSAASFARSDHTHAVTGLAISGSLYDFLRYDGSAWVAAPWSNVPLTVQPVVCHQMIPSTGGFSGTGLFAADSTSSSSATTVAGASGFYRQLTSGTVIGNNASWRNTTEIAYLQSHPFVRVHFEIDRVTDVRMFVGYSATFDDSINNDNPADEALGLQFSTVRGDTSAQFMRDDGTTQLLTATGVSLSANTPYFFELDFQTGANGTVNLRSGAGSLLATATFGAGMPATSVTGTVNAGAETESTTAIAFRTYRAELCTRPRRPPRRPHRKGRESARYSRAVA